MRCQKPRAADCRSDQVQDLAEDQSGGEVQIGLTQQDRAQELAAVAERRNWPDGEAPKQPSSAERTPERRNHHAEQPRTEAVNRRNSPDTGAPT